MSGFDEHWLAMREPVDIRSRDATLFSLAVDAIEHAPGDATLDIGCGTGSTFRALSPKITRKVSWRLYDNDARLLREARRRHGDDVELIQGDLNEIEALPLQGCVMVTASALFDLCSERFIRRFVERVSGPGAGLYAGLNYDGQMHWSNTHPLDKVVTAVFNAHQLRDKGFGPSLGPDAWTMLAQCLSDRGYTVKLAASPWIMTAADADLQRLFLDGVARAVCQTGELDEAEIANWLDFRVRSIDRQDSLCRVGHQDVLAIR